MAKLKSEETEIASTLVLEAGPKIDIGGQIWQTVTLILTSGQQIISTDKLAENKQCQICRVPKDEITLLLKGINHVLNSSPSRFAFEPVEPFFEMILENTPEHGLKVEIWLDAGNAQNGIYTWDAAGIRFQTTARQLQAFAQAIGSEFAC